MTFNNQKTTESEVQMWDPYAGFESAVLPNGLTVYAAHWPDRPWESLDFLVYSGAFQDPVGLEGTAHFVEHLVSDNHPLGHKVLDQMFQVWGGHAMFGSTSHGYTTYGCFIPIIDEIAGEAVDIFGEMLVGLRLEKFIERERQVIVREFHDRYPGDFLNEVYKAKNQDLHRGHWLANNCRPLGSLESIAAIDQSAVQLFYDQHYTPANISIVGVGGMTIDQLVDRLSNSPFAATKVGQRTALLDYEAHFPNVDNPFNEFVRKDPDEKLGLYSSYAALPGVVKDGPMNILRAILGELALEELRHKRAWVYGGPVGYHHALSRYEFSMEFGSLSEQATNEINDVINHVIELAYHSEELFEKVKKANYNNFQMCDAPGRAVGDSATMHLAYDRRIHSLAEGMEDVSVVTMDDIRQLLSYLEPHKRWTGIIRPE